MLPNPHTIRVKPITLYTPKLLEEKDKIVVIKVKWETREKLKRLGSKGDTYDDVISRMFGQMFADPPEAGGSLQ
jgi:hypothetical protein